MSPARARIDPVDALDRYPIVAPWCAVAVAKVHREEQIRETGSWDCECRCCLWVALQMAEEGGAR